MKRPWVYLVLAREHRVITTLHSRTISKLWSCLKLGLHAGIREWNDSLDVREVGQTDAQAALVTELAIRLSWTEIEMSPLSKYSRGIDSKLWEDVLRDHVDYWLLRPIVFAFINNCNFSDQSFCLIEDLKIERLRPSFWSFLRKSFCIFEVSPQPCSMDN